MLYFQLNMVSSLRSRNIQSAETIAAVSKPLIFKTVVRTPQHTYNLRIRQPKVSLNGRSIGRKKKVDKGVPVKNSKVLFLDMLNEFLVNIAEKAIHSSNWRSEYKNLGASKTTVRSTCRYPEISAAKSEWKIPACIKALVEHHWHEVLEITFL